MRKMRTLDRVAVRPDPATWRNDELLTLREAAALMWPNGPLSERSLRTAVREGRLPISVVAGKFFVTKDALSLLSVCTSLAVAETPKSERVVNPGFEEDLALIQKLRGRKHID
jgi:hypothetical protein